MAASQRLRNVDVTGLRFRLIDAKGQVVGRVASQIANILQGKDKPTYAPWKDEGDVVIVVNARHVELTGNKWDQKLYRWHTGYPGGLKERTAQDQFQRAPEKILYEAVYGMLPKNKLRKERARKLRIFVDEDHPFTDSSRLVPTQLPERNIRIRRPLFVIPPGAEPLNPEAYERTFGHMLRKLAKLEASGQPSAQWPQWAQDAVEERERLKREYEAEAEGEEEE